MEFRNWLEAVVSVESVGEAIVKTLEMMVEGDWEVLRNDSFWRDPSLPEGSTKVEALLRNEKTSGCERCSHTNAFVVEVRATYQGFWYDSKTGNLSDAEGISGVGKMEIECELLWVAFKKPGAASEYGTVKNPLGYRGRHHYEGQVNHGPPLHTPMELAKWVNHVVDGFKGFGGGGGGGDDSPEWSPSSDPSLVSAF